MSELKEAKSSDAEFWTPNPPTQLNEPDAPVEPYKYVWLKHIFDVTTVVVAALMAMKVIADVALWAWRSF